MHLRSCILPSHPYHMPSHLMSSPLLISPHLISFQVPFSRVLYIEQSDFRLQDSKDYYGLAPGKTVMLR